MAGQPAASAVFKFRAATARECLRGAVDEKLLSKRLRLGPLTSHVSPDHAVRHENKYLEHVLQREAARAVRFEEVGNPFSL